MRTASWHQALDIQMDVLKFYRSERGTRVTRGFMRDMYLKGSEKRGLTFPTDPEHMLALEAMSEIEAEDVITTLWRGDTCFITSEMMHLVMQAAHDMRDNEIHIDYRNLMTPVGFVLFEEPIFGKDSTGEECAFNAIAWNNTVIRMNSDTDEWEKALELYFFADTNYLRDMFPDAPLTIESPLLLIHSYRAFDNELIKHTPDDELPGGAIVEELLKVFYSIQLLSHQTIGKPMELRPDRATRKRFARDWPDEPQKMITLITLRRKSVKKDEEKNGKVEWSHRWVVRGFWRKQWYPKSQRHDWKYIHEYIKGPEDKPLRLTERRVFDFRR